jgi:hypothetical protein
MEEKPTAFIFYQTEDKQTRLIVRTEGETVWLSQKQMAELFQKDVRTINEHIQNIFEENEVPQESVIRNFRITAQDGKTYDTQHYNLDVIISVGYRVKSHRGTQFRIWATQRLREYIVKGFSMDDERLKEGKSPYFDELLSRIRDIRASEKNFYRKILDIYSTSVDYDGKVEISFDFFAAVQNKMHRAVHGRTAAELIAERANAEKPNMGLTAWKGSRIHKTDVIVAKNYLNKDEMEVMNLIVSQYLDFAELQARSGKLMYMRDWIKKLDDFLTLNDRNILKGMGKVSHQLAETLAGKQYEKFKKKQLAEEAQKPNEDFDAAVKQLTNRRKKK